jgi:MarR family transcriptional regulator for hemolysin
LEDIAIGSEHSARDVGMRLAVVSRLLGQDFDRQVGAVGITRSQWTMVAVVARHQGATQREIAKMLDMSEASAGRLIDRLCADGLLERREHATDRRAHLVHTTEKAQPLLDQLAEIAKLNEGRVFRNFSDDELDTFRTLLGKLYVNLGGIQD